MIAAAAGEPEGALLAGLAEALHEGDWTMAGPEWRWSRALPWQQETAFWMAAAVLTWWRTSPTESDALYAAIRENASPRQRLTDARVRAKAERAVRFLRADPQTRKASARTGLITDMEEDS